jgi:hypothetical protein
LPVAATGSWRSLPALIAGIIEPLRAAVARRTEDVAERAASRQRPAVAAAPPAPPPVDVSSDQFVLRLMKRMRAFEQEERFRTGYLR